MDLIDKKILCELDMNSRIPISQLAKKLHIGRNVVAYRIKNLEDEKIINRYICALNLGKLGYQTYKIYIKTFSTNNSTEKEFIKYITDCDKVIHFLKIEGFYDYSISIVTKDIISLDEFMTSLKSRFKNVIKDYSISILVYSRIFKLDKLLLNKIDKISDKNLKFEKYSEEKEKIDLDEKDKLILREISQKSNESIIEISKNTNLSLDIIKYRIKNLSKVINSFRIAFDMTKLGYYHYTILLKMRQLNKIDESKLFSWCIMNKNVLYYNKRIGTFDFEINIAITDINDLNNFLKSLKNEFLEVIDSYETLLNTELLKLNYYPF